MRSCSTAPRRGRPDRARARNAAILNQLATPGLGSLFAGCHLEGLGQLALALAGFGLLLVWFIQMMIRLYSLTDFHSEVAPAFPVWPALAGAAFFALGWFWSLWTSLRLLRQAGEAPAGPAPPKI